MQGGDTGRPKHKDTQLNFYDWECFGTGCQQTCSRRSNSKRVVAAVAAIVSPLQTVELAMWLETSKMWPNLTSNLLGGGLLADILGRLDAAQQAVAEDSQVGNTWG